MKDKKLISLEKNSEMNLNHSDFRPPSLSSSSRSRRKLKRKTIRKVVHNICISYVSASGSS